MTVENSDRDDSAARQPAQAEQKRVSTVWGVEELLRKNETNFLFVLETLALEKEILSYPNSPTGWQVLTRSPLTGLYKKHHSRSRSEGAVFTGESWSQVAACALIEGIGMVAESNLKLQLVSLLTDTTAENWVPGQIVIPNPKRHDVVMIYDTNFPDTHPVYFDPTYSVIRFNTAGRITAIPRFNLDLYYKAGLRRRVESTQIKENITGADIRLAWGRMFGWSDRIYDELVSSIIE